MYSITLNPFLFIKYSPTEFKALCVMLLSLTALISKKGIPDLPNINVGGLRKSFPCDESVITFSTILAEKLGKLEKETTVHDSSDLRCFAVLMYGVIQLSYEEFFSLNCNSCEMHVQVQLCKEEERKMCQDAMVRLEMKHHGKGTRFTKESTGITAEDFLAANFAVNHQNLESFKQTMKGAAKDLGISAGFVKFCCLLLNPDQSWFLSLYPGEKAKTLLGEKKRILERILERLLTDNCEQKKFLCAIAFECCQLIGCQQNKLMHHAKTISLLLMKDLKCHNELGDTGIDENACESSHVKLWTLEDDVDDDGKICDNSHVKLWTLEDDVVPEGRKCDNTRDPPGQRSVYIAPGDTAMESYRLSTFIKFPQDAPVNPRQLAAAGFYYTGYKDRVKCFCCGSTAEQWQVGDDVNARRWHQQYCDLINGRACGNQPIGGWFGFVRNDGLQHGGNVQMTNINVSVQSGSHNYGSPSIQSARVVRSPSATSYQKIELATISSSFHEQLLRRLDLRKETDRTKTFENWGLQERTIFPSDLARSGFFYLGNLDRVQCFSCGGVLRNWNYGDNVNNEHRRHFPHCRMVNGQESHNVPLPHVPHVSTNTGHQVIPDPSDPSESEQQELNGMFPCRHPINPHMQSREARVATFDSRWPTNQIHATPAQIAKAGFFFLGNRDRVKCWYCNGGLQNWDADDEPWTEHAKWFPSCEFLLRSRGPDFVHRIVRRYPNLRRPQLPTQFEPSGRTSPTPIIIDPQAEKRKLREKLNTEMQRDIVAAAVDMGFGEKTIRSCIKRKLKKDKTGFSSSASLVEELVNITSEDEEDLDETEPMEALPIDIEDTTPSMLARLNELQNERKCRICKLNLSDIVYVPCGHLCVCRACNVNLTRCTLCNEKIERSIRTYIS